jgi:hypothetical protein
MSEFLGNYGFFILIALVMVICHLGHGRHGGHDGQGRREDERGKGDSSPGGGHQH